MSAVKTSDLNIAMVSCLNHAEFVVLNPINNPVTGTPHTRSSQMLDDFGTWAMAHIAFAGMAAFDYDLLRKVKTSGKARGHVFKREVEEKADDEDGSNNSDNESIDVGTLASKLTTLENELSLPCIDDIYTLLKSAISTIDNNKLGLLQSILMDMIVLQPWTRNLDGIEEKELSRMENVGQKSGLKITDLSQDHSDDDLTTLHNLNFSDLPTSLIGKKQPLQLASTPSAKVSKTNTSSGSAKSTTKTLENLDDQLSVPRSSKPIIPRKSPHPTGVTLVASFPSSFVDGSESEEEIDVINAETTQGAQKVLAAMKDNNDDDDDIDDDYFDGMC